MSSNICNPLSAAVLACVLVLVDAHGRLVVPLPRQCANRNCNPKDDLDPDAPINLTPNPDVTPPNDPTKHYEKQSFVCRISEQDMVKTPPKQLTAGSTIPMKWVFPADHPGDGGLYVSYDRNANVDIRQSMKFFKIANFPQMRRDSGKTVNVNLPTWLPPGRAVLRWDWYALHNDPDVEFYANCIDVNIVSSSTLKPADIPSYPIVIAKKDAGDPKLPCTVANAATNNKHCASGRIAEHAFPGNNLIGNGNYRNIYAPPSTYFLSGPQCVAGVIGNCCETKPKNPALPHQFTIVGYNFVKSTARSGGGFNSCVNKGSSGPPPTPGGAPPPSSQPTEPTPEPDAPTGQPDAPTAQPKPIAKPHRTRPPRRQPKTRPPKTLPPISRKDDDDDDDDRSRQVDDDDDYDDDDSELQLGQHQGQYQDQHRKTHGSIKMMHLPVTGADLLGAHLNLLDLNE